MTNVCKFSGLTMASNIAPLTGKRKVQH